MTAQSRTAIRERPGGGFHVPAAVAVVSCDIPEGMTLQQYSRTHCPRRTRRARVRRALGL
jgi:hypothetical protein